MRLTKQLSTLALVITASALYGQETTGTLTGHVSGKTGGALANVQVRISSSALLGERVVVTTTEGRYRAPLLPPGIYHVTFSDNGFVTVKGTAQVLAGQTIRLDGQLTPIRDVQKQLEATVEVVAVTGQVDKTETGTQTIMPQETLSKLYGTSNYAAINLAPGIAGGSMGSFGDGYQVRGGTNSGFKIIQDGVVTGMAGFNVSGTIPDLIESASLIQSPLNAKYGNTDGGIFNIVTSRGSNEWAGSVRRTYRRSYWTENPTNYPNRLGQITSANLQTADDTMSGEWQIAVKGPIWKDHITFAYGGKLRGANQSTSMLYNTTNPVPAGQGDTNTQSLYVPGNGVVRANTGDLDGKLVSSGSKYAWNQYTVYWQISENHSLEAGFTKEDSSGDSWQNGGRNAPSDKDVPVDNSTYGKYHRIQTTQHLSYKAILGADSTLSATYGRSKFEFGWHTGGPSIQYYLYQNQVSDENGGFRPMANLGEGWWNNTPQVFGGGPDSDRGDREAMEHWNLTYQKVLQASGTHVFEAGLEHLSFRFDAQAPHGAPSKFFPEGRVALSGVPASIAGKYLVVPVTATFGDLTGGTDFNYGGYSASAGTRLTDDPGFRPLVSSAYLQYGAEEGATISDTDSLFLNDTWVINANHSLMMGLRMDHYHAKDLSHSILSYTTFSPRIEYKWDIDGTQNHLLSASYAELQEDMNWTMMSAFAQGRLSNNKSMYWTGAANPNTSGNPNAPYLVDAAAVTNLANYTQVYDAQMSAGPTTILDKSVRAPKAIQYEIGFRRALPAGGFLRAALIRKTWKNLIDWFPASSGINYRNPDDPKFSDPTWQGYNYLPATLTNDNASNRNYKSFELEWNFVLNQRLSWGGRYSYIRFTTNASSYSDRPDTAGSRGMAPTASGYNWRNTVLSLVPDRNLWNPETTTGSNNGHMAESHVLLDLSKGKLRQSIALRANYSPAQPYSMYNTYKLPTISIPNYTGNGYPTSVSIPIEGAGAWRGTDTWSSSLHYSLEVPITGTLRWFTDIDITNWLGARSPSGYFASTGAGDLAWSSLGGADPLFIHGQRPRNTDTRAAEGAFGNTRGVSLETGFRF